jgi:hypothetical protein
MKIIKYIIFLSVLGGIFLIVYRNSDSKGLRRYWISFKMAVFIALILAGLIPSSTEAVEPYGTNLNPSIERILKMSGGDQSKFGAGARAKADARKNAKGLGSFLIPGADGFVSSRNYRPYQKPLSARRPGKIQKGPFDPDQEQGKGTWKNDREQTEKYTIESKIQESNTLSKISTKVRKDKETAKGLDNLMTQLENKQFGAGRGAEKLPGSKTVFYMRAGNRARLFFRYSSTDKNSVEILAESNKSEETKVIKNLLKNYE